MHMANVHVVLKMHTFVHSNESVYCTKYSSWCEQALSVTFKLIN